MIMDEGLGFIRPGILPRLPSMVPRATAFSRNSRFSKIPAPLTPPVVRMTPAAISRASRSLASLLSRQPAVAATASVQGMNKGGMVARIVAQPSVQAAIAGGEPLSRLVRQIASSPVSVTDALTDRPPLMQRISPRVDVTDVPPKYSAMPAIPVREFIPAPPKATPAPAPSYASLPAPSYEPDYSQSQQEDIFADMNPDNPMDDGMGNIRSSIMFPEIRSNLGYARSEMDGMGNIFSDIVGGYMTQQQQKTAIALSQQQTAQAQAAARVAEAEARAASAQAASKSGGLPFSPMMLLPVAGLGILLFLKMRKRK